MKLLLEKVSKANNLSEGGVLAARMYWHFDHALQDEVVGVSCLVGQPDDMCSVCCWRFNNNFVCCERGTLRIRQACIM